jgi:site-specific recombinase XerD
MLLLAPVLVAVGQVVDPPQALFKQWLASLFSGALNIEQTKFLNWRTIKNAMKKALKKCGLRPMTFYQAGRHTFASQWVISGNSIYRLKEIMGHSSVQVTERYAHLTNQLTDAELARADIRLAS